MKRFAIQLIAATWLMIGTSSSSWAGDGQHLQRCMDLATLDTQGRGWLQPTQGLPQAKVAVIVGVQCYDQPKLRSLKRAIYDADAMASLFKAEGYDVSLLAGYVSRAELTSVIKQASSRLLPGGQLVFYFAGHGLLADFPQGLERTLLLSDSELAPKFSSSLSLHTLSEHLHQLGASETIIILDTCHAGDGKGRSPTIEQQQLSRGVLRPQPLQMRDNELWLLASEYYQPAIEDEYLGHGVYTYYLKEALGHVSEADLDGNGVVDFLEAHQWSTKETERFTESVQTPNWDWAKALQPFFRLPSKPSKNALVTTTRADRPIVLDKKDAQVSLEQLNRLVPLEPGKWIAAVELDHGHTAYEQIDLRPGSITDLGESLRSAGLTRPRLHLASMGIRAGVQPTAYPYSTTEGLDLGFEYYKYRPRDGHWSTFRGVNLLHSRGPFSGVDDASTANLHLAAGALYEAKPSKALLRPGISLGPVWFIGGWARRQESAQSWTSHFTTLGTLTGAGGRVLIQQPSSRPFIHKLYCSADFAIQALPLFSYGSATSGTPTVSVAILPAFSLSAGFSL